MGNFEAAVDMCLSEDKMAEAILLAIAGGPELLSNNEFNLLYFSDADGLLSQALLMGNFEAAVDMCLSEDKMAEAILLAIAGGPELLSLMNSTSNILQMLMVYYHKRY